MNLRIFGWSYAVTAVSLVVAFLYAGVEGLVLCAILGILEISLSFDNAVVNATVLERMSAVLAADLPDRRHLIAVFGMRLVFPLVIVAVTAGLNPVEALTLALEQRPPTTRRRTPACSTRPTRRSPRSAACSCSCSSWTGCSNDREITWLSWLERRWRRSGSSTGCRCVLAIVALVVLAEHAGRGPGRGPHRGRASVGDLPAGQRAG